MDTIKNTAPPAPADTREARGLALFRSGGIERIARDTYIVPSCTRRPGHRRVEYLVDLSGDDPRCDCRDHASEATGGPCKHAFGAMLYRAWIRRAARSVAFSFADSVSDRA